MAGRATNYLNLWKHIKCRTPEPDNSPDTKTRKLNSVETAELWEYGLRMNSIDSVETRSTFNLDPNLRADY